MQLQILNVSFIFLLLFVNSSNATKENIKIKIKSYNFNKINESKLLFFLKKQQP